MFDFTLLAQDSTTSARYGAFTTPHGTLLTPVFGLLAGAQERVVKRAGGRAAAGLRQHAGLELLAGQG